MLIEILYNLPDKLEAFYIKTFETINPKSCLSRWNKQKFLLVSKTPILLQSEKELRVHINSNISIDQKSPRQISISWIGPAPKKNFEKKNQKALIKTIEKLLNQAVLGLIAPSTLVLNIIGIGYKAEYNNATRLLTLFLAYSHPVLFNIPKEINLTLKGTNITLSSWNFQALSTLASEICRSKKRNVYKGTGIYKENEFIIRKEIKKTK